MSNSAGITDQRHNDYVGSDANVNRIPGAEKATTGHHYIEVFPKGMYHCEWMWRELIADFTL